MLSTPYELIDVGWQVVDPEFPSKRIFDTPPHAIDGLVYLAAKGFKVLIAPEAVTEDVAGGSEGLGSRCGALCRCPLGIP